MSINRTDNFKDSKVVDTTVESKQPLLETTNPRQSISLPKKEDLVEKAKAEAEKKKKTYSLWDFTKFILPFLWKGGFLIRVQTVLTFILLFISKGLNVLHPLLLKFAIDEIQKCHFINNHEECPDSSHTYFLVAMYCTVKFSADFVNNIREIPFANVSASAEIFIAHLVYTHIQNQSLAFHLSRETGKVIRTVSRGSQSFSTILRMALFSIVPLIVELILVMIIILSLYPVVFFCVVFTSVFVYVTLTIVLTEWRAKYFKSMAQKDTEYNQKATDSLLNFETVKYFNAEKHEEDRFLKALGEYKKENVTVAKSLVVLNITQGGVIALGLLTALMIAYSKIVNG
jgi:ATP-binding cassette subfamily B protein